MRIDLSNQVAVVTGGSGELGRVIVSTLAQCGADVAVHYLSNEAKANAVVAEVRAAGRRAIAVRADVTRQSDVQELRDQVTRQLGVADIIVNNAVIQYQWTTVLEQRREEYEGQFRSCVLHNVLMAQAFVPAMIERGGGGRVIAINTECAMQNNPSQSAYVAGKRGMDGLLRVLAKEVGPHGITVNQVAPGWMVSDKYRGTDAERQPEYESGIPLRRRGHDRDVANAVAFLASDLASFITGVYLPVCGGNVMPAI
jgi:3-oxoacyl-[acyl-carrier protein] reductase